MPGITFGIQDGEAQRLVNELRDNRKVDLVVLLSHNGFSTDVKMAGRVRGIDVILGGHTHDGLPRPVLVGKTVVINSGSHGKFLSRLDLDVGGGRVRAHRYKLYPVLSNHVAEDEAMARLIRELRAPWEARLAERLAVSETLLYRRGNFTGTFDEIILDALLTRFDAEVAFSPGFRWGVTIVPGQPITLEDVYAHTGITYPNTLSREWRGADIHRILEDVADNLFHPDPYYRQGGDMVRVGGLSYAIDPRERMGRRITEIKVGGAPLDRDRRYKTASWASPGPEAPGPPAFDVVAAHLRGLGRVRIDPRPRVRVVVVVAALDRRSERRHASSDLDGRARWLGGRVSAGPSPSSVFLRRGADTLKEHAIEFRLRPSTTSRRRPSRSPLSTASPYRSRISRDRSCSSISGRPGDRTARGSCPRRSRKSTGSRRTRNFRCSPSTSRRSPSRSRRGRANDSHLPCCSTATAPSRARIA